MYETNTLEGVGEYGMYHEPGDWIPQSLVSDEKCNDSIFGKDIPIEEPLMAPQV